MALTKVNNDLQDALAAAQPSITSTGTLTNFTSTGIDDNATSNAITITSDEKVAIGSTVANKIFNLADPAQGGEALKLHFEANASADKWAIYAYDRTNGHYANMSFGANSLAIDNGGRVTAPSQPSFLAFLTIGAITSGAVLYNSINHNNGSHYTASNGRFTAPVAGYYYFSVSGICGVATGTEVNGEYRMFKNSTLIDRGHFNHDNRWENVSYSKVISLAVGDYVNMAFLGSSGSPTLYGSSVYTSFSGHLLS